MSPIEQVVGFIGIFFGLLSIVLLFIAAVVALFKIDEADRYYGVGKLRHATPLKGLPFSLGRMSTYGWIVLLGNMSFAKKRYPTELEEIAKNNPPKGLKHMLVWVFVGWEICIALAAILSWGHMALF